MQPLPPTSLVDRVDVRILRTILWNGVVRQPGEVVGVAAELAFEWIARGIAEQPEPLSNGLELIASI